MMMVNNPNTDGRTRIQRATLKLIHEAHNRDVAIAWPDLEWRLVEYCRGLRWEDLDGEDIEELVTIARETPLLEYRAQSVFMQLAAQQRSEGRAVFNPEPLPEGSTTEDFFRGWIEDYVMGFYGLHRCTRPGCPPPFTSINDVGPQT